MFKVLEFVFFVIPNLFKGKAASILKYIAYALAAALAAGVLYIAGNLINNNFSNAKKQREAEFIANKELVVQQAAKIKQQASELDEIKQALQELKQSHEKTLAIVNELKQEQKKIEITVTKKKKIIDKALKQIDNSNASDADKDQQKSAVLIKGLNETYCELFKDSCKEGVN